VEPAQQSIKFRLKTAVRDLTNVLENLQKIKTVRYTHRKRQKEEIGLIAQNIRDVFPEYTRVGEDGYLQVDYAKMVTLCIAGINELSKKIS